MKALWRRYIHPSEGVEAAERLFFAVLALVGIGIVAAASASPPGQAGSAATEQAMHAALGVFCFLAARRVPTAWLRRVTPVLYGLGLVGLLLVFVPGIGRELYGGKRWIAIGGFSFQPSEPMKVAMILMVADFLAARARDVQSFKRVVLPVFLLAAVPGALVVLEPDLKGALILFVLASFLVISAGARRSHIVVLGAAVLGVIALAVAAGLLPHVGGRLSFVDEPSMQVTRSLDALGSGGWAGAGLGEGRMKLGYIPFWRNDFIFTIVGEEGGFLGSLAVLGLYVLVLMQGLKAMYACRDMFGALLVLGVVSLVTLQAAINLCVVTGLVPPTGIILPFLSAGGTSMVTLMTGLGLAVGAVRRVPRPSQGDPKWATSNVTDFAPSSS